MKQKEESRQESTDCSEDYWDTLVGGGESVDWGLDNPL
jgi:hypothetical protein